jgi:hypothetical protein
MKTFKELLIYITVIGALVLGLGAGSMWLISPEPTMKAEAKAPVVPQKFLDSIERKKPVSVDAVAQSRRPCRRCRKRQRLSRSQLSADRQSGRFLGLRQKQRGRNRRQGLRPLKSPQHRQAAPPPPRSARREQTSPTKVGCGA